jgi:DNA-binding response OmpR family regulator
MSKPVVLIVEDDLDSREAIRDVLIEEGFEVREAANGLQALESIGEQTPDLVLLDLQLPVMRGELVLQVLRAARRNLRIVVMSSTIAALAGTVQIAKPFSLDDLLGAVGVA